ncbi:MAG TPA: DEAD/DEAH box helicase [Actinomycetota bacterium]|nr:DEAD/DEAH box helicase [Actinomycetota bacterium]
MNEVEQFAAGYSFPLDPFQTTACESLARGRSVLVCAPTGAGKTVVGEFAVALGIRRGRKTFYTTPLKALSNQKFGDFIARHGAANVGLLTGDNSINGEAPAVVMTTEVLRNMLYEKSPTLHNLGFVVMDEVHYLQDAYRGAVWEEVLIHLPPSVQVVALSATVSNAEEFGDWLRHVRGKVDVVIEEARPVPLEHHYMVGSQVSPTFVGQGKNKRPNPQLKKMSLNAERRRGRDHMRARRAVPRREEVVDMLDDRSLLPAIYFIFSRNGCDQAVKQILTGSTRLTSSEESERIAAYLELRAEMLPDTDLDVLGYDDWRDGLMRGVASHHAGLIPLFKETVEELFEQGLIKVVFATETLSLGINMPAKTVVLEKLIKFTGEKHELMTPGEYTQLTGRAGRRGIDPVGHAVVLFQPEVAFDRVAALVGARTYPLRSSFRPSYNMAVNLARTYTVAEALALIEKSFAQFLVQKQASGLHAQVERSEKFLEGYRERMTCDAGDFAGYWSMVRRIRDEEKDAAGDGETHKEGERILSRLRIGDVVRIGGRGRGMLAVVAVRRGGTPMALTTSDTMKRLGVRDVIGDRPVLGRIELPRRYPWKSKERGEVLAALKRFQVPSAPVEPVPPAPAVEPDLPAGSVWAAIRAHPCHDCPDRTEHERWAARVDDLTKELTAQRRRLRNRTEGLARTFERVVGVLREKSYLRADEGLTHKGDRLSRIYNEGDLLVAEVLEQEILHGLEVPDLAAAVSTLVYNARGFAVEPAWPNETVRQAYIKIRRLWREIEKTEERHGLALTREPEPGFVDAIHAWASGESLDEILDFTEMSPGDFVRSTKQVWDLLRQLAEVADGEELRGRCRKAADHVYRGVIAYSGAL